MAHTSERIYVGDGTGIRLTQDLQPVLGISGGLGYIVRNANINPWSQHKPFRSNAVAFANDNERQAVLRSITHGFTIPQFSSYSYFMSNRKDKWVYNQPTSAYPARTLDFDGYVTEAVRNREWQPEGAMGNWINTIFGGVLSLPRNTGDVFKDDAFSFALYEATPPLAGRSGLLYPIDFYGAAGLDLREYYIGLAFVTSSTAYIITGADKIKNANEMVELNGVPLPSTGYLPERASFDLVPILCSQSITSLTDLRNMSGYNIVTLNGVYTTLTRKSTEESLTIFKYNPRVEGGHAKVNVRITNGTQSPVTLYSMSLYIVSDMVDRIGPLYEIESQINQWLSAGTLHTNGVYVDGTRYARFASLGTQTVQGKGELTITFDFGANTSKDDLGYDYDQWSNTYLCYQLNGTRMMG